MKEIQPYNSVTVKTKFGIFSGLFARGGKHINLMAPPNTFAGYYMVQIYSNSKLNEFWQLKEVYETRIVLTEKIWM